MRSGGLKFAIYLIAVVAATLAVLEITSWFILKKVYTRYFDSSLIIDNKYGTSSGLKPNSEGLVWGKNHQTDEFGGRKTFRRGAKSKWLFIGDSVTEGVGVDDTATFANLYAMNCADYDILNLSLIGYSVSDYVNVLNNFVAKDTTVAGATIFFCLNDVYGNTKKKDLPVMANHGFISRINAVLWEHYSTYKLLKLLIYQSSNRYFKYDEAFYRADNALFNNAMNSIYTCDTLCKNRGLKFNVVIFPYRSQMGGRKLNSVPQKMITDFCHDNHIENYDLLNAIRGIDKPAKLYLFADEIHFSANGHWAIYEFLRSVNLTEP